RRQGRFDLGELLFDAVDDVERVHSVAHHDDPADRLAFAAPLRDAPANVRTKRDVSQIADKNRSAVLRGDRHVFEIGDGAQVTKAAEYMVRGLGYLRSVSDLENVPVATKDGTPVLVRDLGNVTFGPDIRRGVAEWSGEGETVGGIIVMRYGMNALNVIDGVKKKLAEIKPSLPPGVEIVSGYDRSGLIQDSIKTLQRDLLEEALIVSFVTIAFLFHFRSALIPILTLPIAVIASFI